MQDAGEAVLNGGAVPKNIDKDLQFCRAEASLKGRHLFLYDASTVKKVQSDIKQCSDRFMGEVMLLKANFDNACHGRICTTIEELRTKSKLDIAKAMLSFSSKNVNGNILRTRQTNELTSDILTAFLSNVLFCS